MTHDDLETRNVATMRAGFEAWANGTGSPLETVADDVIWEVVGNSVASRVYKGKQDFLSNVIRQFNARLAVPLKPTVREIYADGDTVIVFFDGEATARDGVPYRNTLYVVSDVRRRPNRQGHGVLRQHRVRRPLAARTRSVVDDDRAPDEVRRGPGHPGDR